MRLLPLCLMLLCAQLSYAQPNAKDIDRVLSEINDLRASGCKCGETWMPSVSPVEWSPSLYKASNKYAKYMYKHDHFEHISKEGLDLGDRLDEMRYPWTSIGENLAMGYNNFFDAMKAWKESPSHCRMLMNADMTHFGMSKYKLYWVQSFSRELLSLVAD